MWLTKRMKEKQNEVIKLYLETNLNCIEIGEKVGINRLSVSKILTINNIPKVRKIKHLYTTCKDCGKEITNNHKNRERCGNCITKLRRYILKVKAVNLLGGKCQRCGWSGDIAAFDFHHLYDKDFNLSSTIISLKNWAIVEKELKKCELLCAICHRIEHTNHSNSILALEN